MIPPLLVVVGIGGLVGAVVGLGWATLEALLLGIARAGRRP